METKTKLDMRELETLVKLCESQRDLAYHLQKYREAIEERKKELDLIVAKAHKVVQLKGVFGRGQKALWLTLTPEEQKSINAILQSRHIQI